MLCRWWAAGCPSGADSRPTRFPDERSSQRLKAPAGKPGPTLSSGAARQWKQAGSRKLVDHLAVSLESTCLFGKLIVTFYSGK